MGWLIYVLLNIHAKKHVCALIQRSDLNHPVGLVLDFVISDLDTLVVLCSQMVSKLPQMKSISNLHIDKLDFFRLVHPETAYSFPPLYREVFGSEINFPDSTNS